MSDRHWVSVQHTADELTGTQDVMFFLVDIIPVWFCRCSSFHWSTVGRLNLKKTGFVKVLHAPLLLRQS